MTIVRMLPPLMLLAASTLAAQAPSGEDAAHRADRLRTEQLNRNAAAAVARRDAAVGRAAQGSADNAQARYARALAEWRRRVAACQAGDWSACDRDR